MNMLRGLDLTAEVRALVAHLVADRVAVAAPSVYETGRLVTLAPWLDGHQRRIDFLLDGQRPDGSWGGADGYAVVPTLSAVEAIMTVLERGDADARGKRHEGTRRGGPLRAAAERGLRAAAALLADVAAVGPPPTAGAAMVIAALTEAVNVHAEAAGYCPLRPASGTEAEAGVKQLARLRGGAWRVPLLSHYLELVPGPTGAAEIRPVDGAVCGSAAATAAWLGPRRPGPNAAPSVRMLTELQARNGGPVPAFTSQVYVAQAWSLAHLALAGIDAALLTRLRDTLAAALEPPGRPSDGRPAGGLPGGPGLPADSDTTAVTLYALARLGVVRSPDHLWEYDTGSHFITVHPENEASASANAHILMALGEHADRAGRAAARCAEAAPRIAAWLGAHQRADGGWQDKWHASPFYATRSCALAVHRYGGPGQAAVVDRAVRWVLGRQRTDGSWGRWRPTVEETAYAVQTLLHTSTGTIDPVVARAAARGCRFLIRLLRHERSDVRRDLPLFHGKDLFAIPDLTRAAVLSALESGRRRPEVAEIDDR